MLELCSKLPSRFQLPKASIVQKVITSLFVVPKVLLFFFSFFFFSFFVDERGVLFKYILCQTTESIITFMGHNIVVPKCSIYHTKVAYTKLGQVS